MSNQVIRTILDRVSSPKLTEPGPSNEQLEDILKCALRAPDHARLKPWKFWTLQDQALADLGHIFAKACLDANPDAPEDKVLKCQNMPLRAPLMIVATCEPTTTPKVPDYEQELAVGAAIQNMQIAISSLGLGSIWRTGEMAESARVKHAFGLSERGKIIGFVYIGTPEKPLAPQTVEIGSQVESWTQAVKPN